MGNRKTELKRGGIGGTREGIHTYTLTYIQIYFYLCVCVCVCVFVSLFCSIPCLVPPFPLFNSLSCTDRETDGQTYKWTDGQTDRYIQMDRQIHTDGQTESQTD
jgi:hypothetical protein